MTQRLILAAALAAAGCMSTGMAGAVPPPVAEAAAPAVAQGAVQRVLINPYGEADGLRLADGTVVTFPPHLSPALLAVAKVGDTVRASGRQPSRGMLAAESIVNLASGQAVTDQPPAAGAPRRLPPHLRAQSLQPQQVEGRVDAVLSGPRGEANGVILSDGAIVRFPPDSLRMPVQPGVAFAASGLGTRNALGTSLEAVNVGTSLRTLQPLYARTP